MRTVSYIGIILLLFISCKADKESRSGKPDQANSSEIPFDPSKWSYKEGADYPYRDPMLKAFVYNDTVRTLDEKEILDLLGEPDRQTEGHFYYMVTQKRLGSWPLHTKSLVIKFSNDSIEWIKIHD